MRFRRVYASFQKTMVQPQIWLFVLMASKCIYGQETTTVGNTTSTTTTVSPKGPGKEVCTNKTETAFGLWCYDCQQNFAKVFDPENAVCLFDLSQVALRQCGPRDRYCKVERMRVNQQTITIERTCVEDCYYGCRYNGYGLTQERCTTCCRTPCCNTSDDATQYKISTSTLICMILTLIERQVLFTD